MDSKRGKRQKPPDRLSKPARKICPACQENSRFHRRGLNPTATLFHEVDELAISHDGLSVADSLGTRQARHKILWHSGGVSVLTLTGLTSLLTICA